MVMFGSIAVMKPKTGKEEAFVALMDEWWRLRTPEPVPGAVAMHVYRGIEDPSIFMAPVIFHSREEYEANANDPAQSAWHRKLGSLLTEPPEWIDGDIVSSHRAPGESDPT